MATNFDRITRNPMVMGGKACVRGMRVTVGMIVGEIASGKSIDRLLFEFPYLDAKIFSKLSPMPHFSRRTAKSNSSPLEDSDRHEHVPSVGPVPPAKRDNSSSLV